MANINSGLVGWWRLNEGSGATAYDLSGNGWNAAYQNSPAWTNGPAASNAVFLNGANQYALAPANIPGSLGGNNPRSVACWLHPLDTGNERPWLSWGVHATARQWALVTNYIANNSVACTVDGTAVYSPANSLPQNEWSHVVMTYAGSQFNATNFLIYINGVLQAGTLVNSAAALDTTASALSIGYTPLALTGLYSPCFYGCMQDLRLYSRCLSAGDAAELYRFRPQKGFAAAII